MIRLYFVFIWSILLSGCAGMYDSSGKDDENIIYDIINSHYSAKDTVKIYQKTARMNDHVFIGDSQKVENYDYFESIVWNSGNIFEREVKLDTLFNNEEKKAINDSFELLTKRSFKLKRSKLADNIQLQKNEKRAMYCCYRITYPFYLRSNDINYAFFIEENYRDGGQLYIYVNENTQWNKMFTTPLWFE